MSEIEQNPAFWQALNEGARLLQQNRPDEALERLLPLYEQAPTQADLAINVGGAYILQRKWNRAVEVLSKAVETHPEQVMLWTNLAAAHLGSLETAGPKQQARAIEAYQTALRLNPTAPNLHYHLGLIYKEQGDLTQAIAMFQQALAVDPRDRDAKRWLDQLITLRAQEQRDAQQRKLLGDTPNVPPADEQA